MENSPFYSGKRPNNPVFPFRVSEENAHVSQAPESRAIIRILLAGNYLFNRVYHRLTVATPNPLPETGPAIFVCNHVSGLDPLLIQSASPRRLITWMMAKEYYDVRSLAWVYKTVGAIPVARSGRDLTATRLALRALEAGQILGVFPEGKIAPTLELLPFQTGVALMAIKAGVPVYPAYLDGTQRGKEMVPAVLIPRKAMLRFGPPVEIDRSSTSREALEEQTRRIREAIEALQNQTLQAYNPQTL